MPKVVILRIDHQAKVQTRPRPSMRSLLLTVRRCLYKMIQWAKTNIFQNSRTANMCLGTVNPSQTIQKSNMFENAADGEQSKQYGPVW